MDKYKHITEMENILNKHDKLVEEFNKFLDLIEENKGEYKKLVEYYYSDQRHRDLADDEKGEIPKNLNRGVLSEDAIYNLIGDYYSTGIRLVELGLGFIKYE